MSQMINTWIKHKVFDYAISLFFENVIVRFSPEGKVIINEDQLNDSYIGKKIYWLKTGYGASDKNAQILQNLSHTDFTIQKDSDNNHMTQLFNVKYVVWKSELPDKSDASVTRREISSLAGTMSRRRKALDSAQRDPKEMLRSINNNLIELDIKYPQFDVLLNDMSPSLLKHYVTFIYHTRGLMIHTSNPFGNPEAKRKLQINTEIFRLRSLYEILHGREDMVRFFKNIHENPLG